MLLGTRKTLYDHIIELLLAKEADVAGISAYLGSLQVKATIQGVYKALRELITEDIVVKQKKMYSVSSVWREKTSALFQEKYRFSLSPGEDVVFSFNKIAHLDAFWKHTLNDIQKEIGQYPTFAFLPHHFWYYADGRTESEIEYEENFTKNKIHYFSILGGETELDKKMKLRLQNEFHQVDLNHKANFSRRDHISLMKDYIITTKISKRLAEEIDKLYETEKEEAVLITKLNHLFKRPGTIKIIVENNSKKALALRKRMSARFYIPKDLQEQFELLGK